MADIALLLIVFLLVTTSLKRDRGLTLKLPPMGSTKPLEEQDVVCNVWIGADDQISFLENNQLRPVSFDNLRSEVLRQLEEDEGLVVSLKAERGVDYTTFISVLDVLKGTGAARISIATPIE